MRLTPEEMHLFWEYLESRVCHFGREEMRSRLTPGVHNIRAFAFLSAMDSAFTGYSNRKVERHGVPVDRQLVQYLAGYSLYRNKGHEGHGDHFINRAFNAFINTLRSAILKGQIDYREDGSRYFGCLKLPEWIIEKFMAEAQKEAAHYNQLWDEKPELRNVIRSNLLIN